MVKVFSSNEKKVTSLIQQNVWLRKSVVAQRICHHMKYHNGNGVVYRFWSYVSVGVIVLDLGRTVFNIRKGTLVWSDT